MSDAILEPGAMTAALQQWRAQGLVVGLCHGCFDLVHPGHLAHFAACHEQCDVLIVSITADRFINKGPGRPLYDQRTRAGSLASLRTVDAVFIAHEPSALGTLDLIRPDIYFKGADYSDPSKDATGMLTLERAAVEKHGGRLVITTTEKRSSTDIIKSNRLLNLPRNVSDFVERVREETSLAEIEHFLNSEFARIDVAVVGDLIIDEYVACRPVGTTSKAPAISAVYRDSELMAGGSAAIARHVAEYARRVELICQKGTRNWRFDDLMATAIPANVTCRYIENLDGFTPHKVRFLSSGYPNTLNAESANVDPDERPIKLFEYAYLNSGEEDALRMMPNLDAVLPQLRASHAVICADFGHGLLNPGVWEAVREAASYVSLNVQTNSTNFGFNLSNKYSGADLVCIDELEARLALQDRHMSFEQMRPRLLELLECEELVVTRGRAGFEFLKGSEAHSVPAMATRVVDPVGAGDAVLSILTLCYAAKAPWAVTALLGAAAGAVACMSVGNREPVRKAALMKFISGLI